MQRFKRTSAITAGVGGVLVAAQICGAAAASAATLPAVLSAIKQCESGGNYTAVNPTSGASGAYQFLTSTWESLNASAGYATAAAAPPAVQDAAALELYNADGTAPWVSSQSCWGPLVASGSAPSTTPSTSTSSNLSPASAATASVTPAVTPTAAPSAPFAYRPAPGSWHPTVFAAAAGGGRPCQGAGPGPRH